MQMFGTFKLSFDSDILALLGLETLSKNGGNSFSSIFLALYPSL
jgi:hypothetical protein